MSAIAADRQRGLPVQTYAKLAGVLVLLSFVGCGFGEAYVPSKLIVATEAAATAENLKSSEFMFRLGFAGYLVEACCDVTLALIFYVLLKPVHSMFLFSTHFSVLWVLQLLPLPSCFILRQRWS